MKKIIIFGATGNVGSYVLKYAREYFNPEEYEVIASGRRRTDFFENREFRIILWIFLVRKSLRNFRKRMCMR